MSLSVIAIGVTAVFSTTTRAPAGAGLPIAFFTPTGADVRHGGNRAFYSGGSDHVQMPAFESFRAPEAYYATLAHELTHWTKHKTRLDREFGRKKWGDEGYAKEELVAELRGEMAALTTDTAEIIDIPTEAPEIYCKRQKREIDGVLRKETPEEFTRRVYARWLGKGLVRPDVRKIDKGLYEALYKYGYPDDFDTLLPTAQGRRYDIPKRSDHERVQSLKDSQRRYNQKRSKPKID